MPRDHDRRRVPSAAAGATMSAMTVGDPTPTVTARSAGSLVRALRERAGIGRETLAARAGIELAVIAGAEEDERPLDDAQLDTLLLVLGHRAVAAADGGVAAAPRPLDRYDAEKLAEAAAVPQGEQLERALEWNAFAAELAAAGPPDARAKTG